MKKQGILNPTIMNVIASMGHGHMLVIADAGLPIPFEVERIDLALVKGVPGFIETLETVIQELVVEEGIIAEEMSQVSPQIEEALVKTINCPMKKVSHEEFKNLTKDAIAVIRTGECTPYANIILKSGVNF